MNRPIVSSEGGVTILGAGEVSRHILAEALTHAPLLVAADGGAARALEFRYDVAAVIGDLDSFENIKRSALPPDKVHLISEQETTDFDKCVRSIEAPLLIAVGFTGARLDHELAAFSTLIRHAGRPCLLLGSQDVVFVCPRELTLHLGAGTRVSLFPMGRVTGESTGLRWPIKGLRFAPDGRIGTSNETTTDRIHLTFSNTRMLMLLPRRCLKAVIAALAPHLSRRPDFPAE